MSDAFTGAWLVTEYVYNPDGLFVGYIYQRRMLQSDEDGLLTVYQQCLPQLHDTAHPMAYFEGEWVFRLSRDGRHRRYLGPDVVGEGIAWGADIITGHGFWPRFGHTFNSFGVMLSPQRQITGGRFYKNGQLVAFIIGLAVPERADEPDAYPHFVAARLPLATSSIWQGERVLYEASGHIRAQGPLTRRYHQDGWEDNYAEEAFCPIVCQTEGRVWRVTSPWQGFLQVGDFWLAGDVYNADGGQYWLEIMDGATATLLRLVHQRALGCADNLEVIKLYLYS